MADCVLIDSTFSGFHAGVDEAGRGPLAGPVVAAAVILNPEDEIVGLADSKTLSAQQRLRLSEQIKHRALSFCIAEASVEEIDRLNILQATLLAMQRAVNGLSIVPEYVLVDGNRLPSLTMPAQAIVKGDSKIKAISAASILAKVARDMLMQNFQQQYPSYSFHLHNGYGTARHIREIEQFGILDIHRKSFKPIKTMLAAQQRSP